MRRQANGGNLPFQLSAQHAVADEKKFHPRIRPHDIRCGSDDVFVSFELKQSRDVADDNVVIRKTKLLSHAGPMFVRAQERLDVHARRRTTTDKS